MSFLWKPRTVHKMNAQIGNEGICMAEVLVEQGRKIAKKGSHKVTTCVAQSRNMSVAKTQLESRKVVT